MGQLCCKGIPACWINGWLAAVGATVLDRRLRLHWTEGDNLAVLSAHGCDPVDALVESWPNEDLLNDLPIAETWQGAGVLQRQVSIDSFRHRVQVGRNHHHSWTLSSTLTDLSVDKDGKVSHAPFDPAGPGTVKWLHHRLCKIHKHVKQPSAERIRTSLAGCAHRVQNNGLGFDQTRLGSLADDTARFVDPVVEVMAFFGLALLPMRGDGTDDQLASRTAGNGGHQRGWRKLPGHQKGRRFHWPAWGQPLNADGIDALLDVWNPYQKSRWLSFGVHAAWRSAEYMRENQNDPTRAYGAERL